LLKHTREIIGAESLLHVMVSLRAFAASVSEHSRLLTGDGVAAYECCFVDKQSKVFPFLFQKANMGKVIWRRMIELRILSRVLIERGAVASTETIRIDNSVYDILECALQTRLKCFLENVAQFAARRRDTFGTATSFKEKIVTFDPKQKIRSTNIQLELEKEERLERERQALLRVGESISSKRKRDFIENSTLKERVAKVQQEEEDRIRASVTNQAARSALGEAKYLKWYDLASYTSGQDEGKQTSLSTNKKDYVLPLGQKRCKVEKIRPSGSAADSIILRDCKEALAAEFSGFK